MFDGRGLLGSGDGVELGAETRSLLAMSGDLALKASTERIFAAERCGCLGGLAFSGSEGGLGLGDLGGQCAQLLSQAGTIESRFCNLTRFSMSSCIGETSLSHSEAGNKGTREIEARNYVAMREAHQTT